MLPDLLKLVAALWILLTVDCTVAASAKIQEKNRLSNVVELSRHRRATSLPTDPLFNQQWYLNGDQDPGYNLTEVWTRFTGAGIVIGVVDDGVLKHNDINFNRGLSKDFHPTSPLSLTSHGTKVAGIIAAKKNSLCGVGIAYDASIAAIRLMVGKTPNTDAMKEEAITHALDSIDVYSNSWGTYDSGNYLNTSSWTVYDAIKKGAMQGRKGKGAIYVWAAGNGGHNEDNCAYDPFINSIYSIGITGVLKSGKKLSSGEQCSGILATAYSSDKTDKSQIVTTSATSPNTCTIEFTESSAAAPVASGMAALALQANPDLTWRDVQYLIALSANPHSFFDPYDFKKNGAGLLVSYSWGFGLLDGGRMVDLATRWEGVPEQVKCTVTSQSGPLSIPGAATITVDPSQCDITYLEHVVIRYSFTYEPGRGKIDLTLKSPNGTRQVMVAEGRKYDIFNAPKMDWVVMSVHFWGETTKGTWTLNASYNKNAEEKATGTLHRWALELYGLSSAPKWLHSTTTSKHEAVKVTSSPPEKSQCDKACRLGLTIGFSLVGLVVIILILWKVGLYRKCGNAVTKNTKKNRNIKCDEKCTEDHLMKSTKEEDKKIKFDEAEEKGTQEQLMSPEQKTEDEPKTSL